jgi:hypothetical protein
MKVADGFAVRVDQRTLACSSTGLIDGWIHVELNSIPYPEAAWSDSVVGCLAAWSEQLLAALSGDSQGAVLRFMEGPFSLELKAAPPGRWVVRPSRLPAGTPTPASVTVETERLVRAVVDAGAATLGTCFERSWRTPDVARLFAAMQSLAAIGLTFVPKADSRL